MIARITESLSWRRWRGSSNKMDDAETQVPGDEETSIVFGAACESPSPVLFEESCDLHTSKTGIMVLGEDEAHKGHTMTVPRDTKKWIIPHAKKTREAIDVMDSPPPKEAHKGDKTLGAHDKAMKKKPAKKPAKKPKGSVALELGEGSKAYKRANAFAPWKNEHEGPEKKKRWNGGKLQQQVDINPPRNMSLKNQEGPRSPPSHGGFPWSQDEDTQS